MTTPDRPVLRSRTPVDLIAIFPYLIGFHPEHSLVIIGTHHGVYTAATSVNLPDAADDAADIHLQQGIDDVVPRVATVASTASLIGFGPAAPVASAVAAMIPALTDAGIHIDEVLRADEGRYYCLRPGCTICPAAGTPYDVAESTLPAEAVFYGMVALPDRASVGALIAPRTGPAQLRMASLITEALKQLAARLPKTPTPSGEWIVPDTIREEGRTAVEAALRAAESGQWLSDDEAARLLALLVLGQVRDDAWDACDGSDAQRQLWIDLTRRAEPEVVAAPATLLALTAYLAGDGPLVGDVLRRVLTVHPDDSQANSLAKCLRAGVSPQLMRELHARTRDS